MALRAVPEHPKFAALKATLSLRKYPALGILEALWHFTGKYTPQGNIGKFKDAEIEAWLEWDGESGALVSALVATGWLDTSTEHRLLVHDWQDHADATTKKQLGRSGKGFVQDSGHVRDVSRVNGKIAGPPEPDPEPVPVPVPELSLTTPAPSAPSGRVPDSELLRIYMEYPRKIGRAAALLEIQKAVQRLTSQSDRRSCVNIEAALTFLHQRTVRFAQSPSGKAGKFTPYPATWFKKERYLDDESEWHNAHDRFNPASNGGPSISTAEQRRRNSETRIASAVRRARGTYEFNASELSQPGAIPRNTRYLASLVGRDGAGLRPRTV